MITLFTFSHNEAFHIPKFVDHYRTRFPGCEIWMYDNESEDESREIARALGVHVATFSTGKKMCDQTLIDLKNSCWKGRTEFPWCFVGDIDELCECSEEDLRRESARGTSHIKFEGYQMVNMSGDPDSIDLNLEWGYRDTLYDKTLLFDKTRITEMNWGPGAHNCTPQGGLVPQEGTYKMLHMKFIGENFCKARYAERAQMLSENNRKNGWSTHYLNAPNFEEMKRHANRVI
jgi:hypothetical protein